jgi:hypothetical protein
MKGTSLELQINSIQKEIDEKLERFPKKDREEFAKYIGQFYVKELPNKDAYMGRNTFCRRFEMYKFDEKKFDSSLKINLIPK